MPGTPSAPKGMLANVVQKSWRSLPCQRPELSINMFYCLFAKCNHPKLWAVPCYLILSLIRVLHISALNVFYQPFTSASHACVHFCFVQCTLFYLSRYNSTCHSTFASFRTGQNIFCNSFIAFSSNWFKCLTVSARVKLIAVVINVELH